MTDNKKDLKKKRCAERIEKSRKDSLSRLNDRYDKVKKQLEQSQADAIKKHKERFDDLLKKL